MKRIIRLTESDLVKLVKRVISEQNENTSTPTATLLRTNVLEYTGNLINKILIKVFKILAIYIVAIY